MTNSLRDALEAALNEKTQSEAKELEDKAPESPDVEEEQETHLAEESFDSSEEEVGDKSAREESSEEEKKDDDIAPLDHWSETDKNVFSSLTREGKELIIRRHKEMEASFTKKNQTLSDEIKFSKSIKEALDPFQEYLKQNNLNPTQAIQSLLAVERELRTANSERKQKLIRDLATSYGIQFNSSSEYEGEQEKVDPQQQAILDELFRQKEELRRLQTERAQTENAHLQSVVNDFAFAKDKEGNLKHPHFEELKSDMAMLLDKGRANNLEEAYEQAIYLNNDLRKNHIMRQYNEQRRLEDKKTKLEASKRAGFNIKSKGGTIMDDVQKPMGTRELLSRLYDEAVSNSN